MQWFDVSEYDESEWAQYEDLMEQGQVAYDNGDLVALQTALSNLYVLADQVSARLESESASASEENTDSAIFTGSFVIEGKWKQTGEKARPPDTHGVIYFNAMRPVVSAPESG